MVGYTIEPNGSQFVIRKANGDLVMDGLIPLMRSTEQAAHVEAEAIFQGRTVEMPTVDELLDAAEELRTLDAASTAPGFNTSGPARLLERVAAALTTDPAQRDELTETNTEVH